MMKTELAKNNFLANQDRDTPDEDTSCGSNTVTSKIFYLRGNFTIIGLTGRTGSGCSTVAELLSLNNFEDFKAEVPHWNGKDITNANRKYRICYDFLKENWDSAVHIKVTNLIVFIYLQKSYENVIGDIRTWKKIKNTNLNSENQDGEERTEKETNTLKNVLEFFKGDNNKRITIDAQKYSKLLANKEYKGNTNVLDEIDNFFKKTLPECLQALKEKINSSPNNLSFIEIFQEFGNYIRESGFDGKEHGKEHSIVRVINDLIKFYRYKKNNIEEKRAVIIIDALRNPYEVLYLGERYSAFYLMAINTDEDKRQNRLFKKEYSKCQIDKFDKTEYPSKPTLKEVFINQNIERCTEIADIHVLNNDEDDFRHTLKKQLIHYLCLMKHPGLVPPTHEERTMQIAYTAKYNSGCLSRQVGAVITDGGFSIKAIGWNDVPKGHIPCILRNHTDITGSGTDKSAYSNFELNDKNFHDDLMNEIGKKINTAIIKKLKGRNVPYCFKDIYNNKEKGENNQVHTRSLHAEENAFLQIVKSGGQGIKGGKLFATASPCELCAKKAYQLGIKEIYYIDLYPGISQKHILESGNNRPTMNLFKGAIGRAYIHLYQPILSYKDEIKNILDI